MNEPFNIKVTIEGRMETLLVIPDGEENNYALFDDVTSIGTVWRETNEKERIWCADGMVARELLSQIGEQIDAEEIKGSAP